MTTREMMQSSTSAIALNTLDDGFGGYTSETEGGDEGQQQLSLIQGHRIKFGNDYKYTVNGVALPPNFQAIAVSTIRATIKWPVDKSRPKIVKILGPNEKFPDLPALNAAAPQSEWITGADGKPRGPYDNQSVLYLMGMTPAAERYSFATTAPSGHVAIEELSRTINWKRKVMGKPVYAAIIFRDTLWSKRYSRQRPYFVAVDWVEPSGNSGVLTDAVKAIEETVAAAQEEATPTAQEVHESLGVKTATGGPTLKQDLKDVVPF